MRPDPYEDLLTEARARAGLGRLLAGVGLVLLTYLAVLAMLAVGLFLAVWPGDVMQAAQGLAYPDRPGATVMLLATFAGLLLGPILAAAALHFRPVRSLFGPMGRLLKTAGVTIAVSLPLYALVLGAGALVLPPVRNLDLAEWLGWLPWALPLLLVQVTAEEVLFRGYLQSQLAARFAARWVAFVVPSVLFALLHWNPEAGGTVWLVLATTFVFALIAADLTFRTASLGPAIALHLVNNAFGLLVLAVDGSITGLALWVTPYSFDAAGVLAIALGLNILFLVALWRLLRMVLAR